MDRDRDIENKSGSVGGEHEPLGQGHRRGSGRKRWVMVLALMVMVVAAVVIGYCWDDAPPENDEWARPVFTKTVEPSNALVLFCDAVKDIEIVGERELSRNAKMKNRGSEAEMAAFLEKNSAMAAEWQKLLATDYRLWKWPVTEQEVAPWLRTPYLRNCLWAYNWMGRGRAELEARTGEYEKAVELVDEMLRYSYGLQAAEATGIHWQISATAQLMALSGAETALSDPSVGDALLKKIQGRMQEWDSSSLKNVKLALQSEYLGHRKVLEGPSGELAASLGDGPRETLALRIALRRNRTARTYLELQRPLIKSMDEGGQAFIKALKGYEKRMAELETVRWTTWFNPNAGGLEILKLQMPSLGMICQHALKAQTHHRLALTMVALRRFELAHGQLPERLEQLVPEYLGEVLVDPYDGQPLRWDVGRLRLYSVSTDGVDDGGKFEHVLWPKEADYGMFYWWGEKAAKIREEKRKQIEEREKGKGADRKPKPKSAESEVSAGE